MGTTDLSIAPNLGLYTSDVDWIKIENLKSILEQFEPVHLHPDDPQYKAQWNGLRTKCIDGIWVPQFGKMRYVPGRLGFYAKFCTIVDTRDKVRYEVTPEIRDLEWHFAYYLTEAFGFSGFSNDDHYTSDRRIHKFKSLKINQQAELISTNGKLKEFIEPREYLFKLHEKDLGYPLYKNDSQNLMNCGSRGGGKNLVYSSILYNKFGKTTIGEAKVGDEVYGSDGQLTTITGVFPQGTTRVLRLELLDGRTVDCGIDHLWEVIEGKTTKVLTTQQLIDKGISTPHKKSGTNYRFKIKQNEPVNYPVVELPIHPYVVGYLLGNGTMTTRTPKVATQDKEVIEKFENLLPDFDIKYDQSTHNNYTIVYRGEDKYEVNKYGHNPLVNKLEELGLAIKGNDKHIPDLYKYTSIEQRLELIRGLLDADGHISKAGNIEFTNGSVQLANDTCEVLRSLGIRVRRGQDDRVGRGVIIGGVQEGTTNKIMERLYINTDLPVFFVPRKLERIRPAKSKNQVAIKSIIEMEPQETICISVDAPDNCYLTNDYLVTHNSFSVGLMAGKYELAFHGARYSQAPIGKTAVEIGSGQVSKSSELIDKIVLSNECLKREKFGSYGEEGDDDFEPCPFYMWMDGSYHVNNQRNPWIQQKTVKKGNAWKKVGRKSTLFHSSYSVNKKEGAEASAGGRRNLIIYEEVGLMALIKEVWGSNNAVVRTDSEQYGCQIGIGTSGNIELIQPTQHIFTHPKDYNCLIFGQGNGFFLPAPLTNKDFKDENGNTDLASAYKYYIDRREEAAMASDPQVLIAERMNYPLTIEDMWLGGASGYLPDKEAEQREKELITNRLFENIGQAVELVWDSKVDSGVTYRIKPKSEAQPIYNWPLAPNDSTDGEVMIYIHPDKLKINGQIPNDVVLFLHDPYVSDELDKGGSLGAAYAIVNPKYESFGLPSYQIAATWISRHPHGVDAYNEVLEKLIQFYGNPVRNVWYEANRGDRFKGHMTKKKKNYLLCIRPQFEQGQYIFARNATQTGYVVSNQIAKVTLLDGLKDILLHELPDGRRVIETIPCLFTIKQIRQFHMKGNFDGVSALQGLPLAIKELEHYANNKQQTGVLHSLSKNLVKRLRHASA